MSRRAQRRRQASSGQGSVYWGKWLVRIVSILVLAVILAGFGLYSWLKSYLHSDDFRVFMSDTVGYAMSADTHFELFEWQGMHARTDGFSVENGGVIRQLRADGVQATVGLAGVRRGVWEISDVRANQMDVIMDTREQADAAVVEPTEVPDKTPVSSAADDSGFLEGLLPDRAEVSTVEISSVNLDLTTTGGALQAKDVAMKVTAGDATRIYDVKLTGGVIDTTWFGVPLELQSAKGKYKEGHIFLTESRARVYKRGQLTLKGEVDDGRFAFFGTLSDVKSEEMVPEDWQKRITGDLSARFKVRSTTSANGVRTRGELELKKGILTALPVLDHIAAYSNTSRFRRLNLSEAKLKFLKEGNRLELTEIVMASEGLVRLIGELTVTDGQLDGRFRVGIMPGTLAHIPGAETKVFVRGDKGLLWSPLRITGTLENPKEDLTRRMIAAAGERMFELVPETGKMALKFAHDTATELPGTAVKAGVDILGEGGEVIEEGTDMIRKGVGGMLDLIPGSSGNDQ